MECLRIEHHAIVPGVGFSLVHLRLLGPERALSGHPVLEAVRNPEILGAFADPQPVDLD